MDLTSFLRFWQDQAQSSMPAEDAAQKMALAHVQATQKLVDLKAQGINHIIPVKNSKGAWVPGFDDSLIDEIASLGQNIEQTSGRVKSISNDIIAFLSLSGGAPMLTSIVNERNQHQRRVLATEKHAATALKQAIDKNPHTSPAVLMQRADIAEAYTALNKAKEETQKPLADLDERLKQMRKIIEPYETAGNVAPSPIIGTFSGTLVKA
jgi:hypothetical protein